ncbi:MAG: nitrite/sulfite reductase [Candidatus Omnitrophica bacterium]|nr:nitrite/sulfite reductase [Candidatus Omnitrophota bacterium]
MKIENISSIFEERLVKELPPEHEAEIRRFEREIARVDAGELDPDDFRKFRLENGVYGIRGTMDRHMIRIKCRFGHLNALQLERVADIAEKYTPGGLAHVTTRQAIQLHEMKRADVPAILRGLAEVGLTTREACGNTVRNVTASHYAGISAKEVFDVTPYADLLSLYFLRHPVGQNLPRKFKIAFEGSAQEDWAKVGIHDLGFVAQKRVINGKEVKGFATYVGGGLGSLPFPAQLLEEFTPEELYLPTAEAVIRLFDRNGERKDKNRARIKFLVAKWGIETFRKEFQEERRAVVATGSGKEAFWKMKVGEVEAPKLKAPTQAPAILPGFEEWVKSNTFEQKQKGYAAANVRCPLGDINPARMRALAKISRAFCGGRMRTTISQNILLQWVPKDSLKALFAELTKAGLAHRGAETVTDITRCPGADTCQIAITHSKGLAFEMSKIFSAEGGPASGGENYGSDPTFRDITIKISGCTNTCGQHHIANIGFHGSSKNVDGRAVPHYQLLVGGFTAANGVATFGKRIAPIPAKRTPEATKAILDAFKKEKGQSETFLQWAERTGVARLKEIVVPFTTIPSFDQDPKMFEDLGDPGKLFKVEVGKGECAA